MSGTDRDDLWSEALSLRMRLHERPDDAALRAEVSRWCARSPAHRAAFAEAETVWRVTGGVPRVSAEAPAAPTLRTAGSARVPVLTRRRLVAGLGLAAAAGIAAVAAPDLILRARADILTGTGEVRRTTLPDGSVATLGPDTAVALAFAPGTRQIDLLAGMAYVEVAPDRPVPLRALCGPMAVTAVGTAFEIANDAGWLTAAADSGRIAVRFEGGAAPVEATLEAGDWLAFGDGDGVARNATESGVREPGLRAAWRDRVVVAEREPVAAVVARIARWHPGRVIVAPGFGDRRVSGLFDLRDPRRALEGVVAPFDGHVRDLSPWLTVVSKI
ncbi:FecR domain-containing protein [Rhodoplanes sp. TEM]|uniref:FecR domain-containing protein n=1 Tax=Rhodoplanes tepidamans TaxID=200616 RepID=A0ABT5JDR9_RHOTP|nr:MULTISPECIES: FecR domain-containing protein [Rhodoplanes]MDC7787772.1 FecR domain-containing protein [Rhodoplanes tepidamans]MDC7982665.1 FecR domain-containing protein [Rhodoplanes sp. TEM]MDQ0357688.1 transmembrane sensor [Rhodoplanes tepidamans]